MGPLCGLRLGQNPSLTLSNNINNNLSVESLVLEKTLMDLQFNVESEPSDTLAAAVNGRCVISTCISFGHGEPHFIYAESTFDCRYVNNKSVHVRTSIVYIGWGPNKHVFSMCGVWKQVHGPSDYKAGNGNPTDTCIHYFHHIRLIVWKEVVPQTKNMKWQWTLGPNSLSDSDGKHR